MSDYTEAEAKSKWCPFARTANGLEDAVAVNRVFAKSEPDKDCYCLGSGCMAWRWGSKRNPNWKPGNMYTMGGLPTHPEDEPPTYITDTERGYCGLAGRPS